MVLSYVNKIQSIMSLETKKYSIQTLCQGHQGFAKVMGFKGAIVT